MQLVLASSNKGKLKEFEQMCHISIVPFGELMDSFEIVEDGTTFAQNALIKARTIYQKLGSDYIVISDDSGISVGALDDRPGIYSARYAGENAGDKENLSKIIQELKEKGLSRTPAFYTAAIAIVSRYGEYVMHGWMHGDVIDDARGEKGFGYDPIFIPCGYEQTLGELDDEIKLQISHRANAMRSAGSIIKMVKKADQDRKGAQ